MPAEALASCMTHLVIPVAPPLSLSPRQRLGTSKKWRAWGGLFKCPVCGGESWYVYYETHPEAGGWLESVVKESPRPTHAMLAVGSQPQYHTDMM